MENTGLKGLLVTLYQRVFLSYKTTLLGMAIMALGYVVDYLVASPNKVVSIVGTIVGGVMVLVKQKFPPPSNPPSSLPEVPPPPAA